MLSTVRLALLLKVCSVEEIVIVGCLAVARLGKRVHVFIILWLFIVVDFAIEGMRQHCFKIHAMNISGTETFAPTWELFGEHEQCAVPFSARLI